MEKKLKLIEKSAEAKTCFKCGEKLNEQQSVQSELLCESCETTTELPQSHYYLMQYYYQFAD